MYPRVCPKTQFPRARARKPQRLRPLRAPAPAPRPTRASRSLPSTTRPWARPGYGHGPAMQERGAESPGPGRGNRLSLGGKPRRGWDPRPRAPPRARKKTGGATCTPRRTVRAGSKILNMSRRDHPVLKFSAAPSPADKVIDRDLKPA